MAEYRAKSKVDLVVVYSDRVMVTRVLDVSLRGPGVVVISDLPGVLEDSSVRTKAPDLQIGEIMVRTGYKKEVGPEVTLIEQKIRKLQIQDRGFIDETAVLQERQKFLGSIGVAGPQIISKELFTGKIAAQSWRKGYNFLGNELLKVKTRIAKIERARVDIKEKIDALNRELNDVKEVMENRKTVILDAHPIKRKQKFHVELTYVLYGASWRTYYELRARMPNGKVGLTYYGKINQRTGEDWNNAQLILSTAQPALGGAAPEPYPWYIDIYMPQPEKRDRLAATKAAPAPEGAAADAELREEYAPMPVPVDTGIAVTYPLPGRHTIKSGEPERKVKICDQTFATDFDYLIMPRFAEHAYLTGTYVNNTGYLFLSGDANTYVGDDYTGQVLIETCAPDEKTTVGFGVDDRVKVERNTKKYKVTAGGLMKKVTRYEFEYENVIQNYHKKAVKCKIIDQIPVSQNPDLKVVDVKMSVKATKEEKDRGIYTWETSIEPGKKFTVTISFIVEAPVGVEVEGLSV